MKLKSFQKLVEKRLSKKDLAEIDRQVELELSALRSMQQNIKKALSDYMKQHDIGFNEVVRRMNTTPRQVSKIQKGETNLTLATIASLSAMLGKESVILFKKK